MDNNKLPFATLEHKLLTLEETHEVIFIHVPTSSSLRPQIALHGDGHVLRTLPSKL